MSHPIENLGISLLLNQTVKVDIGLQQISFIYNLFNLVHLGVLDNFCHPSTYNVYHVFTRMPTPP